MQSMPIPFCPTLQPTNKEFENFREFVEMLDRKYKGRTGMVKVHQPSDLLGDHYAFTRIHVVPPKGWKPNKTNYKERLGSLIVHNPIEQNIFGKGGIYQCMHIAKKSIPFSQFKLRSLQLDKITNKKPTEEVEKMFWKNIVFSPPFYGADIFNTLMTDDARAWNLNSLDSILRTCLTTKIKGINTPYCYIGCWKALFCWHTEDLDLSAINYLHQGKSKFWYAILNDHRHILEEEAERLFPEHFSSCHEFLRHKTTLISPYYLKKKYPQLNIVKAEQKENEFIIAFGGSYHCGFNFGFNIAQAVNYGTLDWFHKIESARSCMCVKSSVKISEYQVYKNAVADKSIARTKEFQRFQEFIFQKVQRQESEEDFQEAKNAVRIEFTKKIKKASKMPAKIKFRDQQYQIQHWAQCENCSQWRVVPKPLKKHQRFNCKMANKICFRRQKTDKKIFTIMEN